MTTAEVYRPLSGCCNAAPAASTRPGAAVCGLCGQPCSLAYGAAEMIPLRD